MGAAAPDRLSRINSGPRSKSELKQLHELNDAACRAAPALTAKSRAIRDLRRWAAALLCIAERPLGADVMILDHQLPDRIEEIRALAADAARLEAIQFKLRSVLTEDAWARDWADTRSIIWRWRSSPLRIFSKEYWNGVRALRQFSFGRFPGKLTDRLAILDDLIEGQGIRRRIASTPISGLLGVLWKGEATNWALVMSVCDWIVRADYFKPDVQLRTPDALVDPSAAAALAKSLEQARTGFLSAYSKAKQLLALDEGIAFDGQTVDALTTEDLLPIIGRWSSEFHRVHRMASGFGTTWFGCGRLVATGWPRRFIVAR